MSGMAYILTIVIGWLLAVGGHSIGEALAVEQSFQDQPYPVITVIENMEAAGEALYYAASSGKADVVIRLLKLGVPANAHAVDGVATALYAVACNNSSPDSPQIARALLDWGADPNAVQDRSGEMPLHCAATVNNLAVAEVLLEHGANPNAKNENEATPVYYAVLSRHREFVELLVHSGANINVLNKSGISPLRSAVNSSNRTMTELLLSLGARVNDRDEFGAAPLHWAARAGHADLVEVMLAHGAAVDVTDGYGRTPCELAQNPEVIALLNAASACVKGKQR